MIVSGGSVIINGKLPKEGWRKDKGYILLCNICGKPLKLRPWVEHLYSPIEIYVDPCENCNKKGGSDG